LGHEVATFGVPSFVGNKLAADLHNGKKVQVVAAMDAVVDVLNTINVIAETRGGDKDNVVMLGAHSDSVSEGPGINDDGSGTISLLEVATALANYDVNNAVRFAWWSAEEEGLLGSEAYAKMLTDNENIKVRLFMDYDMMASPNYAYQIYDANNEQNPKGSGELKQLYIDFYESAGLNYTFIPFDGRSDYVGFLDVGIPAGGIATGAEVIKTPEEEDKFGGDSGIAFDPCYHQLCDNLKNVDYEAWVVNTKLIAHSVATYAKSFEGFPAREKIEHGASTSTGNFPYAGPLLIH
jgi:aminopeptidase Y